MAFISNGGSKAPLTPQQIPDLAGTYALVGQNGLRNRIINGNMRINQRGVGSTSTNLAYVVDRWKLEVSGLSVALVSAGDNTISDTGPYHLYLQTSVAKASLAAGDYAGLTQAIEGYNVADLEWGTPEAKDAVLSFTASAAASTTIAITFRNANGTRSYVALKTIGPGKGRYEVVVPGCKDGTWDNTTGSGIGITFTVACGSTFMATAANQWENANRLGAPGMSNMADTLNRFVTVTDVQFEAGIRATPFELRPYGLELMLCQRYYETGSVQVLGWSSAADQYVATRVQYKATKRAAPANGAIVFSGSSSNGSNKTIGASASTSDGFNAVITSLGASTMTEWYGSWVASVEL